jgi:purine-binding chemotaxis protein CheW
MSAPAAVAAPATSEASRPAEPRQLLRLALADGMYAIEIDRVREILKVSGLTELPLMPAFMRGVMNLRGAVVPVIDLAARLGLGITAVERRTCIVILETRGSADEGEEPQRLGVLVDAVYEVLDVAAEGLEPVPAFGTAVAAMHLKGMARAAGQVVPVLECERVLAPGELADQVAAHAAAVGWTH